MRTKHIAPPRVAPPRVKIEGSKIATGFPAAHICGRGGIGRLDGFRFHYLSGVRVRVPPPAPKETGPERGRFFLPSEVSTVAQRIERPTPSLAFFLYSIIRQRKKQENITQYSVMQHEKSHGFGVLGFKKVEEIAVYGLVNGAPFACHGVLVDLLHHSRRGPATALLGIDIRDIQQGHD